jgi:hypothetical protein
VLLILFNLLPVRGLDGAEAWRLFKWRNVRGWGQRASLEVRRRRIESELRKLEELDERESDGRDDGPTWN